MSFVNAILPVLLISIFGFCLARLNFISSEGGKALSKITFTILIPCLLFVGIVKAKLDNIFYWQFLSSYFLPVFIVFVVSHFIAVFFLRYQSTAQSVFSVGASYSNATVIGIPICLYAVGEQALVPLSIIVTFHNFILFTLGTLSAERTAISLRSLGKQLKHIFISFITNPITMSLLAGIAVNIVGFPVPDVLFESVDFLGKAAVPMAFLVLGSSIAAFGLKGQWLPIIFMSALKLMLLPFLVWLFSYRVFDVDPTWAKTAVFIAAAPVGIASYVFSERYRSCQNILASSILVSSILSIISLSFWLEKL